MTHLTDIEQLGYLGMRLAMRRRATPPELRTLARQCAERRNRNLRHWIDHEELPGVTLEGIEKVRRAHELHRGVVLTSFQIGPYNWIPLILNSRASMPVTLLMDDANFQEEQRRWLSRESHYRLGLAEPVRYINSEEPTAVWKMACALRERRTLIGWFDGHTGVTDTQSAKSSLAVKFCDTSMRVRMGLAYLSARTGAPLILAIAHNQGDDGIALRIEDPLSRDSGETIDEFCQRASQHLVSILEREVHADPACWEEWCHLHSWSVFEGAPTTAETGDQSALLDEVFCLDLENVDVLKMSSGDALVSLHTGDALAMTPLVAAIHDRLSTERSGRDVVAGLEGQFPPEEVSGALEALLEAGMIVTVARAAGSMAAH
ncbi:MAG: hypothetical protein ABSC05_18895 [Candidatus Solibacter sp.]